jgi:rhamnose utilization protein RhaD (predicted bifunctional aldolase and dehydrogenase)
MRKFALMLSFLIAAGSAQQALAIAQFQAAFIKEYINDHPDKEFQKFVKTKAKCHICHQGKVTPKNVHHNAYGKHLVELLDAKEDKKDLEKIKKAFEKVAKMHSDPEDDKSPTYGDLIKDSKLPGGDLEASQKEPAEETK